MILLSGGPRQRGVEQGVFQGLVVGEEGEISTLQEETEVTNGEVSSQKLSVKVGVLGFGGGKFLGEKGEWGLGATVMMCKNSTT